MGEGLFNLGNIGGEGMIKEIKDEKVDREYITRVEFSVKTMYIEDGICLQNKKIFSISGNPTGEVKSAIYKVLENIDEEVVK